MIRLRYAIFFFILFAFTVSCGKTDDSNDNDNDNADSLETKIDTVQKNSQTTADSTVTQTHNTQNDKAKPELRETQTGKYFIPEELVYCKRDDVLIDRFYPIGWSKEGNIAYVKEPADEACGCYFFEIVVQNMINDKIEWKWTFNDDGAGETLESVWFKNYRLFDTKLRQFNIIQFDDFELQPTHFYYKGNEYSIDLQSQFTKDPDYGFQVLKRANIYVKSPQLGKKHIYHFTEVNYQMVLNLKLAGHLKNPYEDRMCVVYYEERRGYEGPPNVVYFILSGCHLLDGYR